MKRHKLYTLSRDEITHLANQYIHHRKYREMFIDKFCDGDTYEELSKKYGYEPRYIYDVLKECMQDVIIHIQGQG